MNCKQDRTANLKSSVFPLLLLSLSGAVASQLLLQNNLALAESAPAFYILEQWNLGGKSGWGALCLDATSNLLYIPRTERVTVLNAENGKVAGEIKGFGDARNVALDDLGKYGYVTDISDGTAGYVRVFDRSTFKLISSLSVGRIPGPIVFDPITKTVFAFSARDRSASVIDSRTNTVIASIPLPGKPHIAVSNGEGAIFAGFRGIGTVARIDTASRSLAGTWPIAPCDEFTGLTIDATHRQLLGSCVNGKLISVNADSGQAIPIGEDTMGAGDLLFDPQRQLLISAASSGELFILRQESASQYALQQRAHTLARTGTIAFDPGRDRVYLVTAKFQQRPVN